MSPRLAEHIACVPPSGIRKFFDIVSEMKDAISLGVGEPDFVTPWAYSDAAIYSMRAGHTHYTSNWGLIELRRAINEYQRERFGLEYRPENEILVTVGASEGIDLSLRAVLEQGDEVIIPDPSYVSYMPVVNMCGGVAVPLVTRQEDEFRMRADALEAAITPKTKLLVLPFPCNPSGAVMRREDLEPIAEVLRGTDIMVLSDEIYAELTYGGARHVSFASLPGMKERTVVVNGFSKAYAMTGWRLGYVCGPQNIIEQMTKIHQFAIMCAPTTAQYAAIEALKNGDEDIVEMRTAYNQRRRFLMHAFREMGLECFEPYGAFYVFPCIKEFGMTSEEFATRFLEEEKVAAVPGDAFGASGEGYLRISYAYSLEKLKMAMERLAHFITKLREEKGK